MDKNIEQVVLMTVNIIITSLLLGVIALYGTLAYSAYNLKLKHNAVTTFMGTKSQLYDYDNKIVKGSDIIEVILMNTRLYEFEINVNRHTYIISFEQEGKLDSYGVPYGSKIWTEQYIRSILGDAITSNFKSELIRDKQKDLIVKIKFTQEVN